MGPHKIYGQLQMMAIFQVNTGNIIEEQLPSGGKIKVVATCNSRTTKVRYRLTFYLI